MRKITIDINTVLLLVMTVLLVLMAFGYFDSKDNVTYKVVEKLYDKLLEAKDSQMQTYRAWKDDEIRQALKRDSQFAISFIQHQKVYDPIKKSLAEIPDRIQRIANNDDSIRAAFAR